MQTVPFALVIGLFLMHPYFDLSTAFHHKFGDGHHRMSKRPSSQSLAYLLREVEIWHSRGGIRSFHADVSRPVQPAQPAKTIHILIKGNIRTIIGRWFLHPFWPSFVKTSRTRR
jgi:hypothetical protein